VRQCHKWGKKPLDQYCWCHCILYHQQKITEIPSEMLLESIQKTVAVPPCSRAFTLPLASRHTAIRKSCIAERYRGNCWALQRATAERYREQLLSATESNCWALQRATAERYKHCRALQCRVTVVSVKSSSSLCVLNVSILDKTFFVFAKRIHSRHW
jgi:hypothetical protein